MWRMTARGTRTLFWCAVLAGPPVAWLAVAAFGWRVDVTSPWRSLAWLLAWAVAEELFFRGWLQPALARRLARHGGVVHDDLRRRFLANVATSVLFAIAHLWRQQPLVALAVFPVSLLLGWVRDRSGGVAAPLLLHAGYNACLFTASWLAR